MKMGILAHLSNSQNCIKSNNKIPEYATNYKKEYLFIIGINKEFKYFINKLDDLNRGLFLSPIADRIKYFIKRFLKGQERGKLQDISDFEIDQDDVKNLIFIKDQFRMYKIRWDFFYGEDSDDDSDDDVNNIDDDSDDDSDDDNCYVNDSDDDDNNDVDVYPGFKDIYDVFELFYNKIKIKYEDDDYDEFDYEHEYEIFLDDSDSE